MIKIDRFVKILNFVNIKLRKYFVLLFMRFGIDFM